MQDQHPPSIKLPLALLVLFLAPACAWSSNSHDRCINNMMQVNLAIKNYRELHGSLATDICDDQGHALLSWRFALLPYIEDGNLYNEFHLNEPWDSPHNRALITQIPRLYRCPSVYADDGSTTYLRLLGPTNVLLVEVDREHAVPWSKPEDLKYDPTTPSRGLAHCHFGNSLRMPGGFVVFADGTCRFIPAGIDPDLLREFLASGQTSTDLPWHRALFTRPIAFIIWPWLLITTCGIVGVGQVLPRLFRRQAVSPGEMLWLVAGVGQLTHLAAVVLAYRYEPFPSLGPDKWFPFWFLPSLATTLTGIVPLVWFCRVPGWRAFFAGAEIALALFTLDAAAPFQNRSTDESFITASSPFLLACLATTAALMTHSTRAPAAWAGRRGQHWTGIIVCLLPFAFFVICIAWGVAVPRELIFRVRD